MNSHLRDDGQVAKFLNGANGLTHLRDVGKSFQYEEVNAALQKRPSLLLEHLFRLFKRSGAVRLYSKSEWANCARNIRMFASSLARQSCCRYVYESQTSFQTILLQFMGGCAVSIGLKNVSARANVLAVNLAHQIRAG